MATINVAALSEAAKKYDPIIRELPYYALQQMASKLKLNIIKGGENIMVFKRRKAGGTGPYKQGMEITYMPELMKFYESVLKPELVVFKIKDNILNYQEQKALVVAGQTLDLKTKRHPLEFMIISDIVKSHAEDIVFQAFHAERNDAVFSPATAFTGLFSTMDMLVTNGYIAAGESNLKTTGAFGAAETKDLDYDRLVEFIGSADPFLRSSQTGTPQLLVTETVLKSVREAVRKKLQLLEYPTMQRMMEILREDAFCPGLVIDTHEALGTGSKLVLQKAGNMDLGFDTSEGKQFVQVRSIFEDPNEVQFWLEAGYGTRVRDVHKKVFQTNEQANTALVLAGDY